jgi:hypothetical protein
MSNEEMERTMAFILEQHAQLTVKVDRTAGSITNLLAVAEIQAAEIRDLTESIRTLADRQRESEERGRRTDERLDVLINIVERHVSEGRNGKV